MLAIWKVKIAALTTFLQSTFGKANIFVNTAKYKFYIGNNCNKIQMLQNYWYYVDNISNEISLIHQY